MTTFRTARETELEQILDWAAAEGWNPGLDDAAAFFAADPSGFFIATEGGVPQAAISVVNHSDSFAFLGLYIVPPIFRGQGIGYGLWQHALQHAGTRTIGLDGVPEQQANYAASGFVHAGATTRFLGPVAAQPSNEVGFAHADDLSALIALEAMASGARKPAYLGAWLQQTDTRKTVVARDGDTPIGYCTIRQCRRGAKIGPLVADRIETAERLIHHAATLFEGVVSIDVPETSGPLATLCRRLGLGPGFATARMYRGPFTPGPFTPGASKVYAVTSLELG